MKYFYALIILFLSLTLEAQTFNGGGGNIPDAGPQVSFPIAVSGLNPSIIDTTFGLKTICLNITHPYDGDLNILLQAPNGLVVSLSLGNGGNGDNYTNTCFNQTASNFIGSASAPFTGSFRPQENIGTMNNGQNGNGTWQLLIQDIGPSDVGSLLNWSITFGNNPPHPFNFYSSDLPIVVINTFGATIPDEPKINARMGIIYNGVGVRNYLTNPFNNYNNKIGIELRGSSSMSFPQKSYGFETRDINNTQKDTQLLGMPKEHDWILYAPYDDKTCLRNVLTYDISTKMGHYASRTRYCELLINGQYKGIYVLMEKIKRDNNRVNIAKLQPTDILGDDLTGGYIVKIDKLTGSAGTGGWNSSFPSLVGTNIYFQYAYPSETNIVIQQKNYIHSYVDSFEITLNGPNFSDPAIGFRKYADVATFVDYFITNEISRNVDGYRLSTYLYKDKNSNGGKLKIGPVWDYNIAWWNANYCNGDLTTGWAYQFGNACPGDNNQVPFWWEKLMQDSNFKNDLKCRWTQLRQTTLSTNRLNSYIDSIALYLNESQQRHFTAWPILGVYTWPNPNPIPISYAGEIAAIKSWIISRVAWLDSNIPGVCTVNTDEVALNQNNLIVYPNPFNSVFQLNYYSPIAQKAKIRISDMLGKTIYASDSESLIVGDNNVVIDFSESNNNAGFYLLTFTTAQGSITKKICKVND